MEILNNSIIKLKVRQGSNFDRTQITLDSGELGFTTDQERLFVGNGYTVGGVIAGNKFKGISPLITDSAIQPAIIGDFGFSSQHNTLYVLSANNGATISDWKSIGGSYSGSRFISISSANSIVLNPLSANSISQDLLTSPLSVSGGRIALNPLSAYNISQDALSAPLYIQNGKIVLGSIPAGYISNSAVTSPLSVIGGKIALNPLSSYSISQDALSSPLYIQNGKIALGNIPASLVSDKTVTIEHGLYSLVNGLTSTGTEISTLTNNVTIRSSKLLFKYNALSGGGVFSRHVISYSTLATGHYKVTFLPITTNYIPMATIVGSDALDCSARVTATDLSSCEIKVINSSGVTKNANICLTIDF